MLRTDGVKNGRAIVMASCPVNIKSSSASVAYNFKRVRVRVVHGMLKGIDGVDILISVDDVASIRQRVYQALGILENCGRHFVFLSVGVCSYVVTII